MTIVKICGVKTLDDALAAAEAGADMLGLNFYPPSPRYLEPVAARQLAAALRVKLDTEMPLLAGVFVNETPEAIRSIMETVGLDAAQLSGDEPASTIDALGERAYNAIRPRDLREAAVLLDQVLSRPPGSDDLPALLLDAHHLGLYGGTGVTTRLDIARMAAASIPRLMLAGGLTPENVGRRVAAIRPWGVDVASGVEVDGHPGQKDHSKMRAFVAAVRTATSEAASPDQHNQNR